MIDHSSPSTEIRCLSTTMAIRRMMKLALAAIFTSSVLGAEPLFNSKRDKTPNTKRAKLLSKARSLANNNYYNGVNLAEYEIKFIKCQFVKSFDDELAADEDASSVLATRRFVIFRMCPQDYCNSCTYGYGEYVVDLETYLEFAVDYVQEEQKEMCNTCAENCGAYYGDEGDAYDAYGDRSLASNDCSTCAGDCAAIEAMEEMGYMEATNYLECQELYQDNNGNSLYAGPMCSSNGEQIKIGIFSDEYCTVHTSKSVSDYLGQDDNGNSIQLSYGLLKKLYSSDCISCIEEDNDNQQYNGYAAEPNEFCENLYEVAGKCESAHNFNNGYSNYANYANQAAQENVVCNFISSLDSGTYDETGEIRIGASSASSGSSSSSTSGAQKFFLSVFILGTVGLAVYAAMLHQKITKGAGTDAQLSSQGGTIA